MHKNFRPLAEYIHLYDGMGKPKLDFQAMYALFPEFSFEGIRGKFGSYEHFGEVYGRKLYYMMVEDAEGHEAYLHYAEYQDANENLAFVD